jgi:membrane peptidoglycan carboxypeptidase
VPNVVDAFSKEVAADVIDAMAQVTAAGGTGARASQVGRPVAGKTGTSDKVMSVWFTGFVPQLSTSVALFRDVNGVPQPLADIAGPDGQTGSAFPQLMWLDYMKVATDGLPKVDFPAPAGIGASLAPTGLGTGPTAPTATATESSAAATTPEPTSEPTATAPPTTPRPTSTARPTTTAPAPTTARPGGKTTGPPPPVTAP